MQIGETFNWWIGVVEDRNDPIKLGRVRVRIYSHHTADKGMIKTEDLPWAQPLQQITSAAISDVGHSPTGIVEGTWCVGFWLDGVEGQRPVVMGTLAGIPLQGPAGSAGFNDPNEKYPRQERISEPDVNRLARNDDEYKHEVLKDKEDSREKNVDRALNLRNDEWDQPTSPYDASYPYNHVYESESGHIREYDDTEEHERIHEYHKKGTFYEIDEEGTKVTRVVKNNYEIVAGDDYCYVKGSCNITIDSKATTYVKGDWDIQVDGNLTIDVAKKIDIDSIDNITIDSGAGNLRGDGNIFFNSQPSDRPVTGD